MPLTPPPPCLNLTRLRCHQSTHLPHPPGSCLCRGGPMVWGSTFPCLHGQAKRQDCGATATTAVIPAAGPVDPVAQFDHLPPARVGGGWPHHQPWAIKTTLDAVEQEMWRRQKRVAFSAWPPCGTIPCSSELPASTQCTPVA